MAQAGAAARIAFGRLEAANAPRGLVASDPRELLIRSLVPGTSAERYNRVWRMGPITSNGVISGRIGYERVVGTAELWDARRGDFVTNAMREGRTSPFAVVVEDLVVGFQLRSGLIRRTSFTGAFQALLNEAAGFELWRVHPL